MEYFIVQKLYPADGDMMKMVVIMVMVHCYDYVYCDYHNHDCQNEQKHIKWHTAGSYHLKFNVLLDDDASQLFTLSHPR